MRRTHLKCVAVGLFALGAGLVGCQPQAPPLESGQARELLETWNNTGKKLIEMAEDFPEDKYDFQPTEEVRSFGQMLRHVAASNFRYVRQAQGREYNREEFAPEKFTNKADIAALVKQSYEEGAELLRQATDRDMIEPVQNPYGDYSTSGYAYWMQALEHAAEHYGNLVVYYRVSGLVPPASRQGSQ